MHKKILNFENIPRIFYCFHFDNIPSAIECAFCIFRFWERCDRISMTHRRSFIEGTMRTKKNFLHFFFRWTKVFISKEIPEGKLFIALSSPRVLLSWSINDEVDSINLKESRFIRPLISRSTGDARLINFYDSFPFISPNATDCVSDVKAKTAIIISASVIKIISSLSSINMVHGDGGMHQVDSPINIKLLLARHQRQPGSLY